MLLVLKVILTLLVVGHLWTTSCRDVSEDSWELEKQLEILNKPSIKTFKTMEGETIDCVNIYSQPAFDHPLLKNHKIQLSPTFLSSSRKNSQHVRSALHELREPCPNGTVPIVRVDKDKLITAQSLPKELSPRSVHVNAGQPQQEHLMYLSITPPRQSYPMYGGGGRTSVYNLSVNNYQFSAVQLWVESGPIESESMITAGWQDTWLCKVWPQLNGDGLTRLFTYWRGNWTSGCYNTLCPGFVQVDKWVTPNYPLVTTSICGQRSRNLRFEVKQDRQTGNWWFVAIAKSQEYSVGYWPKELFNHLKDGCDTISYGGNAKGGPDLRRLPPLGSGYLPNGNYKESCYFANLYYINSENQREDIPREYISFQKDLCYGFMYLGKRSYTPYGYNFQLGGAGGYCYS